MDGDEYVQQEKLRRIWDTYDTPLRKTPGAAQCNSIKDTLDYDWGTPIEEHLIGLQSVKGIDVYRKVEGSKTDDFQIRTVDFEDHAEGGSKVDEWLSKPLSETYGLTGVQGLRVLVGAQVLPGDRLRPLQENCPVSLHRQVLIDAFGIPAAVLDKVGRRQRWCLKIPSSSAAAIKSWTFGFSSGNLTAIWTERESILHCFILDWDRKVARERLWWVIDNLKDFCTSDMFLPFLLADVETTTLGAQLDRRLDYDLRGLEEVGKYLGSETTEGTRQASDVVSLLALHARCSADATAAIKVLIDLKDVLRDHFPPSTAGVESCIEGVLPQVEDELWQVFNLRVQEMQNMIKAMDHHVESTQRELKDRLTIAGQKITARLAEAQSMLTKEGQTQQDQAIQLAKATHMIGEATLRDSSSMKTLSLVAMIYLPASTISTIMSMPFFDWGSPNFGSITNTRIWVYFVIVLPLTGLTVFLWWLWLHRQDVMEAWKHKKSRGISK